MKITSPVSKVLFGTTIFAGLLTLSSELSRSQSDRPEIRLAWNTEKEIMHTTAVPVTRQTLDLKIPQFVATETKERREIQEVMGESAKPITPTRQAPLPKFSPPALLDHTELQAVAGYLDYEILPGRGVRFRYNEIRDERMGHEWFLKRPRDLRGKTVRIDCQGYVPWEMTFRIAKSGTSASLVKKVKLEETSPEPQSIFIDIPNTIPFKEVKFLEFWIERETAGRDHGDFLIEKVVVLEPPNKARHAPEESRPEPFPFARPFVPTNHMRAEAHGS